MHVDVDAAQRVAHEVRKALARGAGEKGATANECGLALVVVLGEFLAYAEPEKSVDWLRREADRIEAFARAKVGAGAGLETQQ